MLLIHALGQVSDQLVLSHLAVLSPFHAAGTGIIDTIMAKLAGLQMMFRALSVVGGMGFVIWQGLASRGAIARIIVAGLAAGVFIWIVWNVTELQSRVDNEITSSPAVRVVPASPGTVLPGKVVLLR